MVHVRQVLEGARVRAKGDQVSAEDAAVAAGVSAGPYKMGPGKRDKRPKR